jgi:PmbA protein
VADLEGLCRAAVEAAERDEQVEAYAQETRRAQVRTRDAEVESFTSAETRGVGVRVIVEGRLGYAYAADPDQDGVRALVAAARGSARFAEPDEGNVLPELGDVDGIPGLYREETAGIDPDRRIPLAFDVERAATGSQADVRRVESAGYGDAVTRLVVASTRGGPVGFGRTDCWAYAVALAERDGEVQTGFAYRLARSPDDLDPADAGREAAERAARLLGGTKPETERLPIVLDPVAATGFLGVLAGSLSAESVLKGRSLFADRVGDRVGSEAATVVDDARLEIGPAVAPVDDEGVRTGRTPLVEGGVLRGFLHNTSTAARTGNGARSTGNAGRGTYRTPPAVSPSNLYLVPGQTGLADLLARAGRAIYVQDVTGLHSGANPVSGEFSVGATGLRVEGGAFAEPLREMTIASTLLDLLAGIVVAGDDLTFPGGSLGSPTILVGEMTVGGR